MTDLPTSGSNPSASRTHAVEARLLGQKLVLKTTEADAALVQEVLDLAKGKLDEASVRSKGAAAHQVALLALLDLAEEYLKAKRRTQEHLARVDDKSSQLLKMIEAELK